MKHCKILIIEDHSLTRFGLRTAFESCNLNEDNEYEYEVFESATAQKGIEIADKEDIDLIVMDLGLPDMNGIEATQIIKKADALVNIPQSQNCLIHIQISRLFNILIHIHPSMPPDARISVPAQAPKPPAPPHPSVCYITVLNQ